MTSRSIARKVQARSQSEGHGVTVHRSIGGRRMMKLDPFLLLDEFEIGADAVGAGFPDHPHRGFETVTYMLEGRMEHRDNAGNAGVIGPGDIQWMTAGRGLIHSEMPQMDGGPVRGLQLWVNLAAPDKMHAPRYQDISHTQVPVVSLPGGGRVRVLAGEYDAERGPINGIRVAPTYLDIELSPGEDITLPVEMGHQLFVYMLDGLAIMPNGSHLAPRALAVLEGGDSCRLRSGEEGARFIFVAAAPLNEPVARYGPFVMNTSEEIQQALADYREGRF